MPTFTAFLNLIKPAGSEVIDISQINDNMDDIDTFASGTDTRLDTLEGSGVLDIANIEVIDAIADWSGASLDSNWTVSQLLGYRIGRLRFIQCQFTYSGSTLTGAASGNITDSTIISNLPTAWRPTTVATVAPYSRGGLHDGVCSISTAGNMTVQTLHANGTIASGDTVTPSFAYIV